MKNVLVRNFPKKSTFWYVKQVRISNKGSATDMFINNDFNVKQKYFFMLTIFNN